MSGNVLRSTLIATARFRDFLTRPAKPALATLNRFSQFSRSMNFGNQMVRQSRKFARAANNASLSVSAPLGIMARFGAQAVYDQEKAMNKAESLGAHISGYRNEAMKALGKKEDLRALLSDHIAQLNTEFVYTATEITGAANQLFKAGQNYAQVTGMLRHVLALGLSGDIGLEEAADISTNVMTAMRLPMQTTEQSANSMKRVADNLAYAATASNTDVRLLGLTFKYVGSMAAAAGLSIEEVSAISQVMANNAIKGSEAGVAMRAALSRMINMTTKGNTELARLKVNLDDFKKGKRTVTSSDILSGLSNSGINTAGLKPVIEKILSDKELSKNTAKLSAKLASALSSALGDASIMGGKELKKTLDNILVTSAHKFDLRGFLKAIKKAALKLGENPLVALTKIFQAKHVSRFAGLLMKDLDVVLDDTKKNLTGVAEKMSKIMMKGLVGAVGRLSAAWNNLWVQGAEKSGIKKAAIEFMGTMTALLNKIRNLNPETLKMGAYFLGFLAVMGPISVALAGIVSLFAMAFIGLKFLAIGLIFLFTPMGLVVAGIAAIVAAITYCVYKWDDLRAALENAWADLQQFGSNVKTALRHMGQLTWEFIKVMGKAVGQYFIDMGKGLIDWLLSPFRDLIKIGEQFSGLFTEEQKAMMVAVFEAPGKAIDSVVAKLKNYVGWVRKLYDRAKGLVGLGGGSSSTSSKAPSLTPRASGGPVRSGSSYLVGEQGPELFTPKRGGNIVPNHALGGRSVTIGDIHVHVNGAAAGGDPGQLAHMLGAQVTRALDEYLSDGGQ